QVINALRKAIGTLPVKPLRADIAPASVFSQWMQNSESLPAELRLGDRCELKGSKDRSEEHTSELQSRFDLVCRLLLEKKKCIARSFYKNNKKDTLTRMLTEFDRIY